MSEERTTAREIAQDKVNTEVMFMLGEMKASVKSIERNFDKLTPIMEDHEKRIAKNEDALYNIKLKIGLIGAFPSVPT